MTVHERRAPRPLPDDFLSALSPGRPVAHRSLPEDKILALSGLPVNEPALLHPAGKRLQDFRPVRHAPFQPRPAVPESRFAPAQGFQFDEALRGLQPQASRFETRLIARRPDPECPRRVFDRGEHRP